MKNILFTTRKNNGVPMLKSTLPIILFSMFPGIAGIAATESATLDNPLVSTVTQQNKKVSGVVYDTNGDPAIGANVIVKGQPMEPLQTWMVNIRWKYRQMPFCKFPTSDTIPKKYQ